MGFTHQSVYCIAQRMQILTCNRQWMLPLCINCANFTFSGLKTSLRKPNLRLHQLRSGIPEFAKPASLIIFMESAYEMSAKRTRTVVAKDWAKPRKRDSKTATNPWETKIHSVNANRLCHYIIIIWYSYSAVWLFFRINVQVPSKMALGGRWDFLGSITCATIYPAYILFRRTYSDGGVLPVCSCGERWQVHAWFQCEKADFSCPDKVEVTLIQDRTSILCLQNVNDTAIYSPTAKARYGCQMRLRACCYAYLSLDTHLLPSIGVQIQPSYP